MTPDLLEFHDAVKGFTEEEAKALVEAIERGKEPGADFEAEVKATIDQIRANRKAA